MKVLLLTALAGCCLSACNNAPQPAATAVIAAPDTTWALLPFHKADSVNPVLLPGSNVFTCPLWKRPVAWESKNVFNPAIVTREGKIWMLYRAQDSLGKPGGTSRIGLATSTDGFHFARNTAPVLYPANDAQKKYEWEGGCEDPRVVEDSAGTYYMTYTAYDGKMARLLVASSKDLLHWTKHGAAFGKAYGGKYLDKWSKSGSIVSTYHKDGRIVATRIHGKYWMYWGEGTVRLATSDDLIHWKPVEDERGEPVAVLAKRAGRFDSSFPEVGPPPVLTERG
ncbi:MAG TPA: glycoside hydrolase family 130 protein, partial [Chitinophagaceae bacterium]|nr:glycoside hydrolase family 130 protein [Chitinophagaceae bacterium]